jgi:hypothetical protein
MAESAVTAAPKDPALRTRLARVPMALFDLSRFLVEQELTPAMLARHLRVSELYLLAVLAGEEPLSERDRAACLALATRLLRARKALRAVQIELPFAEPRETFTRAFARRQARNRATPAS